MRKTTLLLSCRATCTDFPNSFAIRLNPPSFPAGLLGYILCPYRGFKKEKNKNKRWLRIEREKKKKKKKKSKKRSGVYCSICFTEFDEKKKNQKVVSFGNEANEEGKWNY